MQGHRESLLSLLYLHVTAPPCRYLCAHDRTAYLNALDAVDVLHLRWPEEQPTRSFAAKKRARARQRERCEMKGGREGYEHTVVLD